MKELKFIKVINRFTKVELATLTLFFNSPYCVVDSKLIELFHYILQHGKINHKSIETESTWNHLYPTVKFNESKWRQICHEFMTAINQYFIFESIKTEKLKSQNLLLKFLYNHEFENLYKTAIAKSENEFQKLKSLSSDYWYEKFDKERNLYDINNYEVNMEDDSNVKFIHEYLDLFYLTEKMKQLVNVTSRRKSLSRKLNVDLESDVVKLIQKNNILSNPGIDIYFGIYLLKQSEDDLGYQNLKEKIFTHLHNFLIEDAVDVLKELINYCHEIYNQGKTKFALESLSLYQFGLKNNYIFPNKKFNPGDFLNIVIIGIRTKEFTWTESFIEEYQKIIPFDQRKTLVTFSLARLYFNQSKYDQVIEKLRDVEFDEITYNLDSKVLLLATYYEVQETQAMSSLAESFRTFLSRHEKDITVDKKQRYANFIKFIKKLAKAQYQDKKAKQKLLEEITNTQGVVNQGWLLEKAKKV